MGGGEREGGERGDERGPSPPPLLDQPWVAALESTHTHTHTHTHNPLPRKRRVRNKQSQTSPAAASCRRPCRSAASGRSALPSGRGTDRRTPPLSRISPGSLCQSLYVVYFNPSLPPSSLVVLSLNSLLKNYYHSPPLHPVPNNSLPDPVNPHLELLPLPLRNGHENSLQILALQNLNPAQNVRAKRDG